MENSPKLGFTGRAMRFYRWLNRFTLKVTGITMLTMMISLALVLFVPQFGLHKPGVEISQNVFLAIVQVLVGIALLGSMVCGVAYFVPVGLIALFEIPIEVVLKKKVYRIVREKQRMSLSALANATGVTENDLSFLLKAWILKPSFEYNDISKANEATGKILRGRLHFDIDSGEVFWDEQVKGG